jgi:hypothetical protein
VEGHRYGCAVWVVHARVAPTRSHYAISESLESLDTCSARYNRKGRHYAFFMGESFLGFFIAATF